jgi:hypothetical protein
VTCFLWNVAKLCERSLLSDKRDVLDGGPLVKILSDEGGGHERWKLVGSAGEDGQPSDAMWVAWAMS